MFALFQKLAEILISILLILTSRFWSGHDASYRRWSLSNPVPHGHANGIILIRLEILEHVVVRVFGGWYVL